MIAVKERIQKILANAGVDSRRKVEEMILQGRISVNGRIVKALPVLIDPEKDKVEVDDEPIRLKTKSAFNKSGARETGRLYIVMNKPKGVYSTNVAQGEQTRAIDLLPADFPARVYPVGRLDAESKGLLLLTNDGDLTNQLTHPKYGVPKTYRAVVDGFITPQATEELSRGVWLGDRRTGEGFKTGKTYVKIVKRSRDRSIIDITIREGRNRQVRRMLAQLGHKVRDLTRIKLGPLELGGLNPGDFRTLTPRELRELKQFFKKRFEAGDKKNERPISKPPATYKGGA